MKRSAHLGRSGVNGNHGRQRSSAEPLYICRHIHAPGARRRQDYRGLFFGTAFCGGCQVALIHCRTKLGKPGRGLLQKKQRPGCCAVVRRQFHALQKLRFKLPEPDAPRKRLAADQMW